MWFVMGRIVRLNNSWPHQPFYRRSSHLSPMFCQSHWWMAWSTTILVHVNAFAKIHTLVYQVIICLTYCTMNYHWLKMKISIPVEFNGFWSYEDIFKQFEPKKMCKKIFLIGENQKSDPQIFLLLSKSSEVCLYLSDNKVWHHSGTKNVWAYSVSTYKYLCLSPCHFLPFKFEVSATGSK